MTLIICLVETHLVKDECIDLHGYTWFGNNRTMHKRAIRGSGGVGILCNNTLLQNFSITLLDNSHEDIISISLTNIHTAESVGICSCYLPPSNSSRGDKSVEFFNVMRMMVLKLQEFDNFIICGDFNARISKKIDFDATFCSFEIPTRLAIDPTTSNSNGNALLDFTNECDLCILNGRFGPNSNKYTSVSAKGAAVVDYALVSVCNFAKFKAFRVEYTADLLSTFDIEIDGPISDHSVLLWNICSGMNTAQVHVVPKAISKEAKEIIRTPRIPRLHLPANFLLDPSTIKKLTKLTHQLNNSCSSITSALC